MKKTILILISVFIALICVSAASAASLADDCAGVINQEDIIDETVYEVTDESADAPDIIIDESEKSNEIIAEDSTANEDIIEDLACNEANIKVSTADESALDLNKAEDEINNKPYVNNNINDTINQLADSIVNQIIGDITIPDINVKVTYENIDIFNPTFNAALHYYGYWNAYKAYYGPFKINNAISAIYALVHQSYGSLDTLNIVKIIFDMDPSIKKVANEYNSAGLDENPLP